MLQAISNFGGMKILTLAAFIFWVGHISAQPVPTAAFPFKMTVEQYVEKYAPLAIREMHRSRIPASITLAQGLLESGNGNSRLALEANNHFGIKCRKEWTGESIREDDDAPQECFRKYTSVEDSYKDHSDFLMKGKRYAFLFDLEMTDYANWAKGLKTAGYATNPRYAEILIATIEKNNLHRFDQMKESAEDIKVITEEKKVEQLKEVRLVINKIPAVIAAKGESYASIALANDLKVLQLYKFNDLDKSYNIQTGDTIYLKPKNYKAEIETVILARGENLHTLSQRYAVKESRLRKYNMLKEGQEPEAGETIYLRGKRQEPIKIVIQAIPAMDTLYDNKIYDDPLKNVVTMKPEIPVDPYDVEARGVKDEMAFIHIVQAGETLFGISKKYNVQIDAIKALNKIANSGIKVGDKLVINPNQPAIKPDEEAIVPGYHVVQSGETLYSIARLYNSTVNEIKSLNELTSDTIKVGDELIVIPLNNEKAKEDLVNDNPSEPVYHIVKEKDTLYSICRKYGVEQTEVRKLNNMLDNAIYVGQKLRVR